MRKKLNHIVLVYFIKHTTTMSALMKATRGINRSLAIHPPVIHSPQHILEKYDSFTFLGMIKQKPHFINPYYEAYEMNLYGRLDYCADWLDDHKMLWTDDPINYRLITIKNKNYFYDLTDYDSYTFDYDKQLVIPTGTYCPFTHSLIP